MEAKVRKLEFNGYTGIDLMLGDKGVTFAPNCTLKEITTGINCLIEQVVGHSLFDLVNMVMGEMNEEWRDYLTGGGGEAAVSSEKQGDLFDRESEKSESPEDSREDQDGTA